MPHRRLPFRALRHRLDAPAADILILVSRTFPWALLKLSAAAASWAAAAVPSRANRLIDRHRRNILRPAGLDVSPCAIYRNMILSLFEFIRLSGRSDDAFAKAVRTEGAEHLAEALARGRGAICITAHYGAWELIPRAVALLGHLTGVVGRRLSSGAADEKLERLRTMHGIVALDRAASARPILELLRANAAVGILIDQDTTAVESDFVDFFGIPALTPVGPARLAVRFGIPVVPLHISRRKDGSHLLVIEEALDPGGYAGADGHLRLTARLNGIIEGWIRSDPEQWIWFHERWCRRPPGCPGLR
ncbi:MAG TPA: lysophospholipid acyltransferase family protein [Candidatus Fermentibacter daniensis]|jgi:KDO2-lipid IV(A) lauroyltransferase|nr:MAG: hypothetical protein AO395_00555 [Candidatus Fermentibacter daniensis]MBP7719608.1 lysophospholipid acyltransferase family protein [Candidatus Fermentibacter sp.]KZD18650.1 MAG: hypothetical protein AO396_02005 [Candidatus Fermentibacter daniensis]MCC6871881.1 lysophospholipid acyltransferase family protein [Candidatus Fermentibacter sp.]NLI03026.1 lysophospholipid acyltransferase family protein [Candidatus Fermentibacter daniensis]